VILCSEKQNRFSIESDTPSLLHSSDENDELVRICRMHGVK
jgi:hypothetical protein